MSDEDVRRRGPVMVEIEDERPEQPAPSPSEAPPVPEPDLPGGPGAQGQAMQTVAVLASRRRSKLAKWFWALLAALLGTAVSVAAWDFAWSLIARNEVLGYAVTALIAAFLVVCLAIVIREVAAFSRLKRVDRLHMAADRALASGRMERAREVTDGLVALYSGREDTRWGRQALKERAPEAVDADALLALAERELLGPLDRAARAEVEAASRQVAAVTAMVPLALADVFAALTSNIRMIRRIAEIYGGRSGTLGSLRLLRAVMTHLVATGAVAVGDDMIGTVAGGGLLAKLSRRFGEGVVNGALTARVGVAAMEVCRPLPFRALSRPSVSAMVSHSLTGLFGRDRDGG
ncbi:TIGR01620 family protein [Aquicoccus sp. SCR17]|nr:TIGR01620 family protein [Carideicomes alvinocaridis]